MPYTPILATLGYVKSPDGRRVLMIHRNARQEDHHLGKYNGLGGKLESFYFAFGQTDAYVVLDLPDNQSAAAEA